MSEIRLGQYEHYKGNRYEVIGAARHSETLEEMVIYRALYASEEFGNDALWVRPKEMFFWESCDRWQGGFAIQIFGVAGLENKTTAFHSGKRL